MIRCLVLVFLLLLPTAAWAQTQPGWPPGFNPSAGQWNTQWSSKRDYTPKATGYAVTTNQAPDSSTAGATYYFFSAAGFKLPSSVFILPDRGYTVNAVGGAVPITLAMSTDTLNGGSPGVGFTLLQGQIAIFTTDNMGNWYYSLLTSGSITIGPQFPSFTAGGVLTTHTLLSSIYSVAWNSSATSPKQESIPTCNSGNLGETHIVGDEIGTAATYPITVQPATGTIDKQSSYVIQEKNGALGFHCDGVSNWVLDSNYSITSGTVTFELTTAALQAVNLTPLTAGATMLKCGYTTAGDMPCIGYTLQTSACSLSSGAGDGGSQIPSNTSGNCWLSNQPPPDIREWGADTSGTATSANAAANSLATGMPIIFPSGTFNLASAVNLLPTETEIWQGNPQFTGSGTPYGYAATPLASGNAAGGTHTINITSATGIQNGMSISSQNSAVSAIPTQCIPYGTVITISGTTVTLWQGGTTPPFSTHVNLACQVNSGQALYFTTSALIEKHGPFSLDLIRSDTPADIMPLDTYVYGQGQVLNIQTSVTESAAAVPGSGPAVPPYSAINMFSTFRGDDCLDFSEGTGIPTGNCGGPDQIRSVINMYGDKGVNFIASSAFLNGGGALGYSGFVGYLSNWKCLQGNVAGSFCNIHGSEWHMSTDGTPASLAGMITSITNGSLIPNVTYNYGATAVLGPGAAPVSKILDLSGGGGAWAMGLDLTSDIVFSASLFSTNEAIRWSNGDGIYSRFYQAGEVMGTFVTNAGSGCPGAPGDVSMTLVHPPTGSFGGTGAAVMARLANNGSVQWVWITNNGNRNSYFGTPWTATIAGCGTAPNVNLLIAQDTQIFGTNPFGGIDQGAAVIQGGDYVPQSPATSPLVPLGTIEFVSPNTGGILAEFVAQSGGGFQLGNPTGGTAGDEGFGTLNVQNAYYQNGTIGVTCSGSPTASFASKLGIVTHC